jgi:hypothetical protein
VTELEKNKDYKNIIEYAKDINSNSEPVIKSNCKLCNSVNRQEAEEMFAQGKSSFSIYKWLKTKGESISDRAVHNHLIEHYQNIAIQDKIKIYADNLQDYSKIRASEEEKIRLYSILLDRQIHILASQISPNNNEETRKSNENLIKLVDQAIKLQERINNIRSQNEPLRVFIEKINNALQIKYDSCSSEEMKKAINEMIEIVVHEMKVIEGV